MQKRGGLGHTNRKNDPSKVSENVAFHAIDGAEIRSILGLADALGEMSDDTYYHHVNQDNNDFANWINAVFNEKALAQDMKRAGGRLEAEICILRYMLKKK